MKLTRASGILLHPTSLPGRFGIGDLGAAAYDFVDFLARSGQSLWQIMPLGPSGYGDSPYSSFSAFAGNTLLISPERLVKDGLLTEEDIKETPDFPGNRADYGKVTEYKRALLNKAYENFKAAEDAEMRGQYDGFLQFAASWLDDYALFSALKDEHKGASWHTWQQGLVKRTQGALDRARATFRDRIEAHKFFQFVFFKQWLELKSYCAQKRVKLVGDMPIFVAHNSADVWARPEFFKLNEDGSPKVVAGVPPDDFSETGQLWGNPIYDWERMRADGFKWWIERLRATFLLVDIVRIDHFRGFAAYWEVPAEHETAERGQWVNAPGKELFTAVKRALGEIPVMAEDLGTITPDVYALRDEFNFPGMRVLQFAFGGDASNPHLPHNYVSHAVAYTGTHDNDTVVGWFESRSVAEPDEQETAGKDSAQKNSGAKGAEKKGSASESLKEKESAADDKAQEAEQLKREREYCLKYLGSDGTEIHWDFIRAAYASVADTAIIQLQDALGLDSSARMNLPASTEGNWAWRFAEGALTDELSARLKEMSEVYGRLPS